MLASENELLLNNIDFSENDIIKAIASLPNKDTLGPDNLPVSFLKRIATSISLPLSILFRKSFNDGIVPNAWKVAHVIPLFKGKGSKHDFQNYRPISICSSLSKIMERIIYNTLSAYMFKNNFMTNHQHGFTSNKSTVTHLLEFTNDLTNMLDQKHSVDVVCIDFSKAFDTVSHEKLLLKLRHYGVSGKMLTWISDYLNNRSFAVKINGSLSDFHNVTSSVPQGSILAPLLFAVYINDLALTLQHSKLKLYADDLTLYRITDNMHDSSLLQQDLNTLMKWSSEWQLNVNFDKCHVIHLGYNNNHNIYHLHNTIISESKCEKILGVHIDNELSYTQHVFYVADKARKLCNMLLRSFAKCNANLLIQLYKIYVRPVLEYGSIIWFSQRFRFHSNIIENVQKYFTRRICLSGMSYKDRLSSLNLQPVVHRMIVNDLTFMYRYLRGGINVNLSDCILLNDSITRGNDKKLKKLYHRLDVRGYFFAYRVVSMWNSLHNNVVSSNSLKAFKCKMNNLSLDKFYRWRALLDGVN